MNQRHTQKTPICKSRLQRVLKAATYLVNALKCHLWCQCIVDLSLAIFQYRTLYQYYSSFFVEFAVVRHVLCVAFSSVKWRTVISDDKETASYVQPCVRAELCYPCLRDCGKEWTPGTRAGSCQVMSRFSKDFKSHTICIWYICVARMRHNLLDSGHECGQGRLVTQ